MKKVFKGMFQRKEQTKAEVKEKWSGESGTRLSYPMACLKVERELKEIIHDYCDGLTCEVGCGDGRIAALFDPRTYMGLDINANSISRAKESLPTHDLRKINWEDSYPLASTYLFFTVLLHIPDAEIDAIIKKLSNKVVVIEAMGRWLRDYGRGNNYQRDPIEYRALFKKHGFKETCFIQCSSTNYPFYFNGQVFKK